MPIAVAQWIVRAAWVYLAVGACFALPFALLGAARIDPAARGGSLGFRLLLLPGSVALWPLLALRWARGGPPEERSAHRRRARDGGEGTP